MVMKKKIGKHGKAVMEKDRRTVGSEEKGGR